MAEKSYAPLSAACVKSLNDNQKRKAAALEIEKMVKEFTTHNNAVQIKRLIKVLGDDFCASVNAHSRKGGLIGLAAVAIGLGKEIGKYLDDLIPPVLNCFGEPDSRVRYHACESLYNIVKVARTCILPHFTNIFEALSKLACDTEQNVRVASELLDKLLKDIVTENENFELTTFIPLLRERMYTKSPFGKMFIISWISVLDSVPDIDLVVHLPEILDGLFKILEDPNPEIKQSTYVVLSDFLRSIKMNPSRVNFANMINILIVHAQSSDEKLQLTAITWIDEFLQLSGAALLPFISGILTAVLPCLSYEGDTRKLIKGTANRVNANLLTFISAKEVLIIENLDLASIVEVLTKQLELQHISVQTKVAVLKWIYHLLKNFPDKMLSHTDTLFPVLMKTIGDTSEEVVQQCVIVIAEMIKSQSKYFTKFIANLIRLFSADRHLLEDRGVFIITKLCIMLNPDDIFKTFSENLIEESNLRFASVMVQTLSIILLTSSELFNLRSRLKDLDTEESVEVFIKIYKSWCHNPVAAVALCFLTQNYHHAYNLIKSFESIEVTVELLVEIDKLIQLIESPIFTFLRLELLEIERNQYLLRALYGLLMILPQSEAFQLLQRRLSAIPCNPTSQVLPEPKGGSKKNKNLRSKINFEELLSYFTKIQENHKKQKHDQRVSILVDS